MFCNNISISRTKTNVRDAAIVGKSLKFSKVANWLLRTGELNDIKALTLNLSSGKIIRDEPDSSSLTSSLCFTM